MKNKDNLSNLLYSQRFDKHLILLDYNFLGIGINMWCIEKSINAYFLTCEIRNSWHPYIIFSKNYFKTQQTFNEL